MLATSHRGLMSTMMAAPMASRVVPRPKVSSVCSSCRHRLLRQQTRFASNDFNSPFSSSTTSSSPTASRRPAPRRNPPPASIFERINPTRAPTSTPQRAAPSKRSSQSELQSLLESANAEASTRPGAGVPVNEPYHLNVFATRNNIHITFSEPSRDPIVSYSCGDIGLRKAQRGSFDAAYQLATYAMRKMAMHQWRVGGAKMTRNPMKTLRDVGTKDTGLGIEVIFRGFGPGREAFQKALLGTEGQMIKPMIVRVTDGTRLKFGGTRSPAVRRL